MCSAAAVSLVPYTGRSQAGGGVRVTDTNNHASGAAGTAADASGGVPRDGERSPGAGQPVQASAGILALGSFALWVIVRAVALRAGLCGATAAGAAAIKHAPHKVSSGAVPSAYASKSS